MTKREIRTFINEVSPSPGYILDLSKIELADIVYDLTNKELEDYEHNGTSNAKRLSTFLEEATESEVELIKAELITLKGSK